MSPLLLFALLASLTSTDACEPKGTSGTCHGFDEETVAMMQTREIGFGVSADGTIELESGDTELVLDLMQPDVHILSQGRVGSCFVFDLFKRAGLAGIFEPLNHGGIDGQIDFSGGGCGYDPSALDCHNKRLQCLYKCQECHDVQVQATQLLLGKLGAQHDCDRRQRQPIVIKTVAINDFADLSKLGSTALENRKFILLLRDPRGSKTFNSNACKRMLAQLLSLKELVSTVGQDMVKIVFFEHWTQNVEGFAEDIFKWAGVEPNSRQRHQVKAVAITRPDGKAKPTAWFPDYDGRFDEAEFCSEFLDMTGYGEYDYVNKNASYSKLLNPSAFLRESLTDTQAELLQKVRSKLSMRDSL